MTLHDDRMTALADRERLAYRTHHTAISTAQRALSRKLRQIELARDALAGRDSEDEVLVRNTPGPSVEIFHTASDYCRRVNLDAIKRGKYDHLFLSEALDRGLRPCSACAGHLVQRRQRPASGVA